LEARVGALETKVDTGLAALDKRVSTLEANAFTISGSLNLSYYVARAWQTTGNGPNVAGEDFDIDRLGISTQFSSGDRSELSGDSPTQWSDFLDQLPVQPNGSVGAGSGGSAEGRTNADLTLNFSFKPRVYTEASGAFQTFPLTLSITFTNTDNFTGRYRSTSTLSTGTLGFKIASFQALFSVGAAPVVINFGIAPAFKFTNYGFNNGSGRGDGFVASIDGSSLLPLNPTLTLVYGSKGTGYTNGGTAAALVVTPTITSQYTVLDFTLPTNTRGGHLIITYNNAKTVELDVSSTASRVYVVTPDGSTSVTGVTFAPFKSATTGGNGDNVYFTGIKGSLSLIPGITGGVYYGVEGGDVLQGGATTNLLGVDFGGKLFGFLGLEGEWNLETGGTAKAQVASYVKANLALDPFTISGNWRFIDVAYTGIGGSDSPYKLNQKGFGINLGLKQLLGFLDFSAYYDSYSRVDNVGPIGFQPTLPGKSGNDSTNARTTFGVGLGLRLIGFDIAFNLDRANEVNDSGNPTTGATFDETKLGVKLAHDGSKSDALIGGLNLALGYKSTTNGLLPASANNTSQLYAYADFAISLGGFKITPAGWFASQTSTKGDGNSTALGGKILVDAPFLFSSMLNLGAAINNVTGSAPSNTLWLKAGLTWDSFLLPNSTFSVSFAIRNSKDNNGQGFGPSFKAPNFFDSSWGSQTGGVDVSLKGLYFEFGYYGLGFYYGIFNLTGLAANQNNWGQVFGINYALKF
jgi:hypothetical protein